MGPICSPRSPEHEATTAMNQARSLLPMLLTHHLTDGAQRWRKGWVAHPSDRLVSREVQALRFRAPFQEGVGVEVRELTHEALVTIARVGASQLRFARHRDLGGRAYPAGRKRLVIAPGGAGDARHVNVCRGHLLLLARRQVRHEHVGELGGRDELALPDVHGLPGVHVL